MIKPFLDQDFYSIKSDLLSKEVLFEDPQFPADLTSIYRSKDFAEQSIEWKRPNELVAEPVLFLDYIEPENLDKGLLKNFELIDSIPCLVNNRENLSRIIPDDQDFFDTNYSGIFHFRFWMNGEWVDVVIDDRLPVNNQNELLFCKNAIDKNEMYAPLLEKAYAKFKICYEFLNSQSLTDIMLDFTGAVNEQYNLTRCLPTQESDLYIYPRSLWEVLVKYSTFNSLFSCSVELKPNERTDQYLKMGIHAQKEYSIKKIYQILKLGENFDTFRDFEAPKPDNKIKNIQLLLIQNPVGKKELFNGKWADGSAEWMQLDPKIMHVLLEDKSECPNQFFVDFDEYYTKFTKMNIFHPDRSGIQKGFEFTEIHNEWIADKNSGGRGYYPAVFWTNPQHEFDIPVGDKYLMGLISILQKVDPEIRNDPSLTTFQKELEEIGFHVHAVKPNAKKNSSGNYEKPDLKRVATIKTFKKQRQISKRVLLPPSKYIIMPCTYDKERNAKYLLRYYFEIKNESENANLSTDANTNQSSYEKWYFDGLNEKDIENIVRKGQSASSAACSLM